MPSPLFRKVDCIRLSVKDMDSGITFYCDQLGLELIWKTQHTVGLRMPDDTTEIVLHTEPKAPEIDLKVQSAKGLLKTDSEGNVTGNTNLT